ncbi:MAG: hypothetical protein R6U70_00105 [Bacillota bacterium]
MHREKTFSIEICGLHRTLGIKDAGGDGKHPSLPLCGDVTLTNVSAGALATKMAHLSWDLLAGPAPESIPLMQVLSTFLGREYYLPLHRRLTSSMRDPLIVSDSHSSLWVLDGRRAEDVRGRDVMLITDVITSDDTLRGARTLIERAEGRVTGCAAILVSPPIARRRDHFFLAEIPSIG